MEVIDYVSEVMKEVDATASRFRHLEKASVSTFPIPFFGRIDQASVLTVGVNPSATEFQNRAWPASVDATYLGERLLRYFESTFAPPHPWFQKWSFALQAIEASYERGNAAHIDISPRATRAMSKLDPDDFLGMVRHDVRWLFRLLNSLDNPRLLLMAGCVTKKRYMNHFFRETCSDAGWRILGEGEATGSGRVGFHALTRQGHVLPAFFCSVSPSGDPHGILRDRLKAHGPRLRRVITGEHPGWISDKHLQLTEIS